MIAVFNRNGKKTGLLLELYNCTGCCELNFFYNKITNDFFGIYFAEIFSLKNGIYSNVLLHATS